MTDRASKQAAPQGSVTAAERAISALVGYTAGAAVVLPFDRVKSLMQVSEDAWRRGAWATARHLFATSGVAGLYKGGGPHMLIAPYTVFYYVLYDELLTRGRAATSVDGSSGHSLVPLGAAMCARTVETAIRMPLELVRTMMQTSDASVTLAACLRTQFRQPPHSWFRGTTPTLLRDVPFSAVYWLGYESLKSRVQLPEAWVPNGSVRTAVESFGCGAASGILAAVLIAPLDVIKTVRQHEVLTGAASDNYRSILSTLYQRPAMAFAGLGPRLVRIPIGLATMMAALEATKRFFERRSLRRLGGDAGA